MAGHDVSMKYRCDSFNLSKHQSYFSCCLIKTRDSPAVQQSSVLSFCQLHFEFRIDSYLGAQTNAFQSIYKLIDSLTLAVVPCCRAQVGHLWMPNPNKPQVRVGEGAVRELAAALLDHAGAGQVGVPETILVELNHQFFGARKGHRLQLLRLFS